MLSIVLPIVLVALIFAIIIKVVCCKRVRVNSNTLQFKEGRWVFGRRTGNYAASATIQTSKGRNEALSNIADFWRKTIQTVGYSARATACRCNTEDAITGRCSDAHIPFSDLMEFFKITKVLN